MATDDTGYDDPELYDLRTEHLRDDLRLFVREAARWGEPVLELGCGTGRVCVPLARQGFAVTGLELDAPMLQRARMRAHEAGATLRLVRADMRRFAFTRGFRLVMVPFAALHDLPRLADWEACLRCVRDALVPGGALVFDDHAPGVRTGTLTQSEVLWTGESGDRVETVHTLEALPELGITRGSITYRRTDASGRSTERMFPFAGTWADRATIETMIARAGLQLVDVLGDYHGTRWHEGCPRMIYRARRP